MLEVPDVDLRIPLFRAPGARVLPRHADPRPQRTRIITIDPRICTNGLEVVSQPQGAQRLCRGFLDRGLF